MRLFFEKYNIYILLTFVTTRLVYKFFYGLAYDCSHLVNFVHFMDRGLLETDLLKSLFYMHSQPPLYNFFAGTVVKISNADPAAERLYFGLIFLAAGFLISLAVFRLMINLGVGRGIAFPIVVVQLINPSYILFENTVVPAYPLALIMCAASMSLFAFAREEKPIHSFFFFMLIACASLIHSMFHLLWMISIFVMLFFVKKKCRKALLLTFLLPFVLVVSVSVKNLLVFDFFGSSSWLGMSLAKMTTLQLGSDLKDRLVADGVISKLAYVRPFRMGGVVR